MLVQNLAITYKCYSAIGNSLNLKDMIQEVLRVFVSETYASYAVFTLNEDNNEKILSSFGKIDVFSPNNYIKYKETINRVKEKDKIIVIIRLNYGSIFLVTSNITADCTFYLSMFESFVNKLNMSIESCLNLEKVKESNLILEKQKKELLEANKIKDDFLANMSHELKTPLNSINVISSIMKKNSQDNLTQKQVKNLQIINQCGKDLLFLVNDVLDISKLEAGEIILNYEEVNLKTFIDKIYNTFLPQMENKGLNFIVNYNSDIDFIETDEMRLNQIIYNLLSNALKFTNKGTVTIDVTNTLSKLIIIVEDTGVGIPENKINHIFDRFKQVDTSINRKYSGTGLGLAISRELAYLLKGDIFLESKINKYTKIELHIPINSNDKIEILGNNYKLKKDKNSILVLNNEPLFFFKIIVELAKKYEIEQVNNLTDFLKNNTNKKFEKAIMYTKEYTEELNQKLSNTHNLNYVVIYEKCDKDLTDLIKLTYEKNEFLENINNIKDLL